MRDSAGTVVVAYPRGLRPPRLGWIFSATPELEVGGSDALEGADLWGVAGYQVLPGGGLAVLSSGHKAVRVYDAAGALVRSIGRGGQGPGELELFPPTGSMAFVAPDTILVLHRRGIEAFLVDGTPVASIRIWPTPNALGPGTSARPAVLRADRGMLGVATPGRWEFKGPGQARPPHAWVVYPSPTQPPRLLEWVQGITQEQVTVGDRRTVVVPPFPSYPGVAIGPSDDAAYVTYDTERYEFKVYDRVGKLRRIVRWDIQGAPVRDEWIEAWKDDQRLRSRDPQWLPGLERAWTKMTVPENLPPMDGVAVDELGYFWVRRTSGRPDEAGTYDVFDPAGELVGQVESPAGLRHMTRAPLIGEDYLIGVWIDSLGAESVRRYSLDRRVRPR